MAKATLKNKDVAGTDKPVEPAAKFAATASTDVKRMPVKTLRVDDCSLSIWRREYVSQGQPRTFWSCTIERSYTDKSGARKYTGSFDPDSLGKIVTLCQQASEFITSKEQDAK